jgi:1,4-alpha-glucan branching enzyme
MGANLSPTGVTFRVWAPNATGVHVSRKAEGWTKANPMAREPSNAEYWSCDIPNLTAGDEYQFVIDNQGEHWRADARSRDVNDDDQTDVSSFVVDPTFQWSTFSTPRFDELILYQVHVGSFAGMNDNLACPGGTATFDTFAKKLEYIKNLGFNALALLPLSEFPSTINMGYAPSNFFAPETAYGSPASLRALVDLAHQKDLAVIFDVVYNHASTQSNRLWNYDGDDHDGGIYFEKGGDSPFGHKLAHWKIDVKNFCLDNARMWLDEYRGDGLRFDVAHGIARDSLTHILSGLRANPFWKDKFFIAEWDGNDRNNWPDVIHNIGFNAVWEMDSVFAFSRAVARNDAIGNIKKLINLGFDNHWNRVVYLLGSHDNIRDGEGGHADQTPRFPIERFGGRTSWFARAQCRMGYALTAFSPGVPMLFMGCEGHHHGYWWPNPDNNPVHNDHRLDWSIMGDPIGAPMQRLVADANNARRQNPALRSQTLEFTHEDPASSVIAFKRWTDDGNVIVAVANFSDTDWLNHDYAVLTSTPGQWQEIFNSQSPDYDGYPNSGNFGHQPWTQADGKIAINLPKWSVLLFRKMD